MRKTEFMNLLKYYFRNEDKGDLKGIIEDCNEQFRLGAKEGKTEEEVCCKLGHPKNIYRYYIGKPIVPEDNERLAEEDSYTYAYEPPQPTPDTTDWDDEPEPEPQRPYGQSQQAYGQQQYRQDPYADERVAAQEVNRETGKDFNWNDSDNNVSNTAKAVASPFLDILGTLFSILSGFLYLGVALAIVACIGIYSLPSYFYTDLLPLPTLSLMTMVCGVLAILFAALTATYAGEACHDAAHRTSQRRRS